ncbi:unnamed protein product [marine sediment metagenome]|uniref:Uncharacterized protein n=1 Tax=marine sediment metagenome TaxID=412755 RepID=X1RWB7_9ZZZZ
MLCSHCGKTIVGKPRGKVCISELASFDGDKETAIPPTRKPRFCSKTCEWLWWLQEKKSRGMSDQEARRHLIEWQGLTPPASA